MMPRPSSPLRWLLLVLLCTTGAARAQLVDLTVTGATEETRGFATLYKNAPDTPAWSVLGKAVAAYRVNAPTGTITIQATLTANTAPRAAQGPTSTQSIALRSIGGGVQYGFASGHPNEAPTVEYSFPYNSTGLHRGAFQIDVPNLPARCGLDQVSCSGVTFYLVFMFRDSVRPTFDGFTLAPRPRLYPSPVNWFVIGLDGLNPFTDVVGVNIDGVAVSRMASGTVPLNQSPGANKWDRYPFEQPPPSIVSVPGTSEQTFDKFLGCGGACGASGVRVGMPADITTGLHHLTITGHNFQSQVYHFYGNSVTDLEGSAELLLDEQFIFLKSKLQVTPDPIVAGQNMTVHGTGFAPDVILPVKTDLSCCGTHYALGNVHTDLRGDFTLVVPAPAASAPFFAGVWNANTPPGSTASGSVFVPWGDAAFKQKYNDAGIDQTNYVTFVKGSGNASTTTTTTTPDGSTTTSTTAPLGCPGGCDDDNACTTDACVGGVCTHTQIGGAACALPPGGLPTTSCPAVPPKVDQSYDKAAELLGRALDKPRKVVKRLIKKADKLLKRTKKLADAAELLGKIPPGCADDIGAVVDDVRSRVGFVLEHL